MGLTDHSSCTEEPAWASPPGGDGFKPEEFPTLDSTASMTAARQTLGANLVELFEPHAEGGIESLQAAMKDPRMVRDILSLLQKALLSLGSARLAPRRMYGGGVSDGRVSRLPSSAGEHRAIVESPGKPTAPAPPMIPSVDSVTRDAKPSGSMHSSASESETSSASADSNARTGEDRQRSKEEIKEVTPGDPVLAALRVRRKPETFFKPFEVNESDTEPKFPVCFEPSLEFREQIEVLLAEVSEDRLRDVHLKNAKIVFPNSDGKSLQGALVEFHKGHAIARSSIPTNHALLVIGDVHGDAWSLAAACSMADDPEWLVEQNLIDRGTPVAVVFLGDIVDRGSQHAECAVLVAQRMQKHPTKTVMIAGNHDVGQQWNEMESRFQPAVFPAEFTDWLNDLSAPDHNERVSFGREFLEFAEGLPRAVLFKSGLLATHGAVPHADIFPTMKCLKDVQTSPRSFDDFTWVRVAERAPVKLPNRGSRGCEIGTEQFAAAVAHLSGLTKQEWNIEIRAVVRGHDHHAKRHFVHEANYPSMTLVTLNTMGTTIPDENPLLEGDRQGCIGIYAPDRAPRIVKLVRQVVRVNEANNEADSASMPELPREAPATPFGDLSGRT